MALDLIAVAARRGPDDLHALAQLARGEEVSEERVQDLTRAGLVRGGARPHVPARLLIPALALDAALGLSGEETLAELATLLTKAQSPRAREMLLHALQEELLGHIESLGNGKVPDKPEKLSAALGALDDTLAALLAISSDAAAVTRTATLCARLVDKLAYALAPRRRAKSPQQMPALDAARLAGSVCDMVVSVTRTLRVPSAESLAAALAGPQSRPQAPARAAKMARSVSASRKQDVLDALAGDSPVDALYKNQEPEEALARHSALIRAGADTIAAHGWEFISQRTPGPDPLEWSTDIARTATNVASHRRESSQELAA